MSSIKLNKLQMQNINKISMNMMWINSGVSDSTYIIDANDKNKIDNIASNIKEWILLYQKENTTFNFWYDGTKVTNYCITNTINYFNDLLCGEHKAKNIFS